MPQTEALARLRDANDSDRAAAAAILARAGEEAREPNEQENETLASLEGSRTNRDKVITDLEKLDAEETTAAEARSKYEAVIPREEQRSGIVPGRPEPVYRPGRSRYFADVFAARMGNLAAMERLHRHNLYMEQYRPEYREWAGGGASPYETMDGTSTSATSFGSFIPPVWLLDEIAEKARTGRVVPNLVRDAGPPTSTSITIPRVTTGTSTAIQTADNAALAEVDVVTAQLTRATATIGGIQDIAVQGVELSPMAVDRFIFGDLIADYNRALDSQCIIGTGGSGQLLGLDALSGVNAVTYTDATPTVGELYSKIADAIQQVHTARFQPPDTILMHPRRWGWFTAAVDSTGRPLVTPYAPMNPAATPGAIRSFGPVGSMQGLDVYTDANIPTTLGGGTEDEVYVGRFQDMLIMEGPLRTEVFRDIGSATATVRFRVYAFVNLFVGRFPAGVSRITGTGLIAPTF